MIYVEYLFGSLVTIGIFLFSAYWFSRSNALEENSIPPVIYRQSHIYELIKDSLPEQMYVQDKKIIERQSSKHEENTNIKVIIMDNSAYWIKDNKFYVADFKDDSIDKDSVRTVDTMNMDKVQLDKMFFIMDQLRDGDK